MILNINKDRNLECRLETSKSFYKTFKQWATDKGLNVLPIELMPWDFFVVSKNNKDILCTSLFVADHMAILWHTMGDKKYNRDIFDLSFMFKSIEKYCKKLDIAFIMGTAGKKGYKKLLERTGWCDVGVKKEDWYLKIIEQDE